MREIKFRGKRLDNGKWVYGDLITYANGEYKIRTPHESKYMGKKRGVKGKVEKTHFYNSKCQVDLETIGQFTGAYDKNGTKIFEGDIIGSVFHEYQQNCLVRYVDGVLCATVILGSLDDIKKGCDTIRPLNNDKLGCGWVNVRDSSYDFTVKGNIYDNPLGVT